MLNSLDLPKAPKDTRIVVAMSGGVDSSVVAALLAGEGYDVVGITLQLYSGTDMPRRAGSCCAGQDIEDARRVAETLGIPHYVLDYEEIFRRSVIDPFAESYIAGETPIPCVSCNQTVKFRDLLATARDLGADALATGHYIDSRLSGTSPSTAPSTANEDGTRHRALFRPADLDRDQSYFLYATTQVQLDFLRFPLGRMTKPQARAIATRHGLVVADKPDSQDICFVSKGRYFDVIEKLRPEAGAPGEIVHVDGRTLGRHDGIVHFTIGQRRGIKIASPEPLYVVELDSRTARVVVGPRSALATHRLVLRAVNWLGDAPIESVVGDGLDLFVKVRSTRPPMPARLSLGHDGTATVDLDDGEDGVAPGQACVFYAGDGEGVRVLGGGIIARTERVSHEALRPASLSMAAGG